MKKYLIVILSLFFVCLAYSQESPARGELFIHLVDRPASYTITVEVSTVNTYWLSDEDEYGIHDLSTNFDGDEISFNQPTILIGIDLDYDRSGADFIVGLGLYKLEVTYDGTTNYILVDYRISALPECATPGGPDISFDYHLNSDKWTHHSETENINGTTQNFWDVVEVEDCTTQVTTEFEPYPPDTLTTSAWYGHPKLEWVDPTKTDDFRTNWEVWRKFSKWELLVTRPDGYNLWVDWTYEIGEKDVQYKVRATNGDAVSTWSNIVGYFASKKISTNMNANSFTYELMQNYPNPFNPTTNINFSLKEDSYITLKVYDVLGREVDILVNGNLPAGVHSVEFNGESFESGLYFYEINTGTFRDTKKFILIK